MSNIFFGVKYLYLKNLEIFGFKSFADKTELGFVNATNGVVGPNGSGKSNISDAIRWVLGEQSAKSLRGGKMEDVIFAGCESRKPLGFAEVTITIDNEDKKMSLDYSEVNITRRIYRSGESEYYINKTPCRLKDIYELFMDTGIGRDGYSIIGQGRIDEILSSKSDERRSVFEEAAGITKFKNRKNESERKLINTRDNLDRAKDILKEVEDRLAPTEEQAKVARRYLEAANELKKLEINLFISSIEKAKNRKEAVAIEVETTKEQLDASIEEQHGLQNSLTEKKAEAKLMEQNLQVQNEELYNRRSYFSNIENERKLSEERKLNIENDIVKLKRNLEANEEDRNTVLSTVKKETSETEILIAEKLKLEQEISTKEEDYSKKLEDLKETEGKTKELQDRYFRVSNSLTDSRGKIDGAYSNLEGLGKRKEQLEEDSARIVSRVKAKEEDKKVHSEDIGKFTEKGGKLADQLNSADKKRSERLKELNEAENRFYATKTEIDKTKSRLKLLEEMEKEHGGFSKAVKILLTENKVNSKGLCGVIADLITVPKEYVTAAEVAMGQALQNVVVETEEDAKGYIQFLKEQKAGRATFLPVSSIEGRRFNEDERFKMKIDGLVGIGSELISIDKKYGKILDNLLGRTVFVKDIDAAIKLSRKTGNSYRVVTLAGEIINAGGAITGGSLHVTGNSILSRKAEIEDLKEFISGEAQHLDQINSEIEDINEGIESNALEREELTEEIQQNALDYNTAKHKLEAVEGEMQVLADRLSINEKEEKDLNNEAEELENTIKVLNEKVKGLEIEKDSLEKAIKENQEEQKSLVETKDRFNHELTLLKLKQNSCTHKIEAAEDSIRKQHQQLEDIKAEDEFLIEEIGTADKNLKTTMEDIGKFTETLAKAKEEIAEADKVFGETDSEKKKLQSEIEGFEQKLEFIRAGSETLQNAFHKIEMQQAKVETELESLEIRLMEQYDINIFAALAFKDDTISLSFAQKRTSELKEEIKEMGTVNVNAVEEFEQLKERFAFLNKQIDDLEKAGLDLERVIEELTANMRKQFLEQFHLINANFNTVFVKLFGGGEARLELSDMENVLESGIEIIVRPPGKKLQNLSLLSGGERALTAISILFAILMIKPAPFCVLDEIDAALDDANVDRYASFLKEFSVETQFIIVTHRKGTMEVADCLYGVTMEESGVSRLVSVKLEQKSGDATQSA